MNAPSGPGRFVESPTPPQVAGYADAVRAGVTPRVPTDGPPALDGRTPAHGALRDVFVVAGAAVAAIVVTMVVGGRGGSLGGGALLSLLVVSGVGIAVAGAAVRRFGRAQVAELQHGYTTATYRIGRWWMRAAPDGPVTTGRVEWDWSGTWVLRSDGSVVSEPRPDRVAPGLYPSPRRAGVLELWTGHQWSGHVVPPDDRVT